MKNESETTIEELDKGLMNLLKEIGYFILKSEPVIRELKALNAERKPLFQLSEIATLFVDAIFAEFVKLGDAEYLMKQGWVPHYTTPFNLVSDCGQDSAKLLETLLAYYADNWTEIRAQLEARFASLNCDEETKATLQEALEAHQGGLYRCVTRVLFPAFEREFRLTLLDGRAGRIAYKTLLKQLIFADLNSNKGITDYLFSGFEDLVLFGYLFGYLFEEVDMDGANQELNSSTNSKYVPSLSVSIKNANIKQASLSPIPTRHAVVHGLVDYSSLQTSLNTIFIADYIFSVVSEHRGGTIHSKIENQIDKEHTQ